VVATDSEAAAPRELDEKPIWVRGVPPRCFFLSGFLSLFIPPPESQLFVQTPTFATSAYNVL
jgi:hypothetical protein